MCRLSLLAAKVLERFLTESTHPGETRNMCGIVGGINVVGLASALPTLLDRIAHRGPDAAGTHTEEGPGGTVALGHRRLSIIDLSAAANQPFEKDGHILVFNGEIYNYRRLADELKALGVVFRTHSDTEVVLEAWKNWGPKCLARLRGMFAFAIYERHSGRLVLARDPFGIKPLYVMKQGDGIAFSSELKALVPLLGKDAEVDDGAVLASLVYSWLPDDYCLYHDIFKLPAGHWLEARPNGTLVEHVYWDEARDLAQLDRPEVGVDELRSIISESVKLHMVSDVPVSTFLSGGLDSSILTVLAKEHAGRLESYTTFFRAEDQALEAMPDDLGYARQLAKLHGIRLHEIELQPDVVNLLPHIVDILDEPLGDASAVNVYLICRAARDAGVKVLLSGIGADEIFGGYRRQYACLLARRYQTLPSWLRDGVIARLVSALPVAGEKRGYRTVRWAKRFMTFANLPEEQAFLRSFAHYDRSELAAAMGREMPCEMEELFHRHATLYAQGPADDHVNRMCFTDLRMFLRGLNLFLTDRASMAASTEVRVPFVDVEVVKAAFATPGSRKIVGKERKASLKKAAEAWLPRSIIYRPKAMFSMPLRSWIRRDLCELVDDTLSDGEIVGRGYLSRKHVRTLIDQDRAGTADNCREIWKLLTLDLWLRNQKQRVANVAAEVRPIAAVAAAS
jgi:asparagine synthase (glutamine-hydrolysing)